MLDLNDPTAVALLCAESFERAGVAHAVYGGLLTAAYGEPRETRVEDFAVVDLTADQAARVIRAEGLDTSVSFERTRFGGLLVSRLALLGSKGVASGLNTIDLIRPRSDRFARQTVGRAIAVPLRGKPVRVLTPEDFILFKALSTRDRDMEDAAGVLRRNPGVVDLELMAREVELLSAEITDFDVRARHAEILRRGTPPT